MNTTATGIAMQLYSSIGAVSAVTHQKAIKMCVTTTTNQAHLPSACNLLYIIHRTEDKSQMQWHFIATVIIHPAFEIAHALAHLIVSSAKRKKNEIKCSECSSAST